MADAWAIPDLSPQTPVSTARTMVLDHRFSQWSQQLLLLQAESTSEHIHDFRVATRRLRVAIKIFSGDPDLRRPVAAVLRRLASACGRTREFDIALTWADRWVHKKSSRQVASEAQLLKSFFDIRRMREMDVMTGQVGQADLAKMNADFTKFRSLADFPFPGTLGSLGHKVLSECVNEFHSLNSAGADPLGIKQLHALRISAKALRYASELFICVYDVYPWIEKLKHIQDDLGTLHDLDVLIGDTKKIVRKEMRSQRNLILNELRITRNSNEIHARAAFRNSEKGLAGPMVRFADFCLRQRILAFRKFHRSWRTLNIGEFHEILAKAQS